MTQQIDPEELITIDVTPREIPAQEQEDVQGILNANYPGHVLVVPDFSEGWLFSEIIEWGVPPEEVAAYLEQHPDPFILTFLPDSLSLPLDELSGICAELADPATADDDCTLGSEDDQVPDEEADLRFYRVRRGFVGDDVEPYTTPTLPVVISIRDETVVAIS